MRHLSHFSKMLQWEWVYKGQIYTWFRLSSRTVSSCPHACDGHWISYSTHRVIHQLSFNFQEVGEAAAKESGLSRPRGKTLYLSVKKWGVDGLTQGDERRGFTYCMYMVLLVTWLIAWGMETGFSRRSRISAIEPLFLQVTQCFIYKRHLLFTPKSPPVNNTYSKWCLF